MLSRFTPLFMFTLLFGASSTAYADIESGTPEPDLPAEEDKGEKAGGCSVETAKLELAGLAALVLLVSGTALRRRPT